MTTSTVNDELAIDPIQVGRNADVVPGGTGIGVDAIVDHRSAVGIGRDAQSLGNNATAIGTETRAPANWNGAVPRGRDRLSDRSRVQRQRRDGVRCW